MMVDWTISLPGKTAQVTALTSSGAMLVRKSPCEVSHVSTHGGKRGKQVATHPLVACVEGNDAIQLVRLSCEHVDDLLGHEELDEGLLKDVASARSKAVNGVLGGDAVDRRLRADCPPAFVRVEREQEGQDGARLGVERCRAPGY